MKKIVVIMSLSLFICASVAYAQSQPSAKATFAYREVIALPSSYCASSPSCTTASNWTTILTQEIKMAQWKDLFIDASLQCGIVTDTTVKSSNLVSDPFDVSEARGTVRVRVEITDLDGNHIAWAEPDAGADADPFDSNNGEGVVFCDRIQTLKAKFAGLTCTVDPVTYVVTCADPEELELILKTLNANSFNFVAADLDSGVYKVKVQAMTSAKVTTDSDDGSLGSANAFIGAGSVAIESVRMIKGEQVEF